MGWNNSHNFELVLYKYDKYDKYDKNIPWK